MHGNFKGEFDEWTHHFCETCQSMKPKEKFTMTIRQRQFLRKPNCTDCSTQQRGGLREVPKAKNDKSKARKLHCSDCQKLFDFVLSGHITEKMREEHFRDRKRRVVCYECHDKGKVLVREDQQRLKARKLICAECKKPFDFDPSGHITENMRKDHLRSRQDKVICYACEKNEQNGQHTLALNAARLVPAKTSRRQTSSGTTNAAVCNAWNATKDEKKAKCASSTIVKSLLATTI